MKTFVSSLTRWDRAAALSELREESREAAHKTFKQVEAFLESNVVFLRLKMFLPDQRALQAFSRLAESITSISLFPGS